MQQHIREANSHRHFGGSRQAAAPLMDGGRMWQEAHTSRPEPADFAAKIPPTGGEMGGVAGHWRGNTRCRGVPMRALPDSTLRPRAAFQPSPRVLVWLGLAFFSRNSIINAAMSWPVALSMPSRPGVELTSITTGP